MGHDSGGKAAQDNREGRLAGLGYLRYGDEAFLWI